MQSFRVVKARLVACGRDLLAAPLADARELLQGRMPVPKLLQTDQGGSQARRNSDRS